MKVFDFEVRFVGREDFASGPDKFIIFSIGFDDVNKVILFKGIGELDIGDVFEIVMWLNIKEFT